MATKEVVQSVIQEASSVSVALDRDSDRESRLISGMQNYDEEIATMRVRGILNGSILHLQKLLAKLEAE